MEKLEILGRLAQRELVIQEQLVELALQAQRFSFPLKRGWMEKLARRGQQGRQGQQGQLEMLVQPGQLERLDLMVLMGKWDFPALLDWWELREMPVLLDL
jgi:hypothetical protein